MQSPRTRKIFALLPPQTSDLDESSDEENNVADCEFPRVESDAESESSEATSLPPDVKQIFDQLSATDTDSETELRQNQSPKLNKKTLPETPKSVFTPLKTRSQHNESGTVIEEEEIVGNQSSIRRNKTKMKKKEKLVDYIWSKEEFQYPVNIPENNFSVPEKLESPLHYFEMFFSEYLLTLTVENTNLYCVQQTGKSLNITHDDIKYFFAIHIWMGIIDIPSYLDYWSTDFRYPKISEMMSLKKYQQTRRFIHFANNAHMNNDLYYRIRLVLDIIRRNCINIEEETRQSIDEMMVPYKGKKAGSRRQL